MERKPFAFSYSPTNEEEAAYEALLNNEVKVLAKATAGYPLTRNEMYFEFGGKFFNYGEDDGEVALATVIGLKSVQQRTKAALGRPMLYELFF